MKKSLPGVTKESLQRYLEGHRKANEIIKKERHKQLREMTAQESLQEYDFLCSLWEANPNKQGIEQLEQLKIEFLLKRRRLLDKIGRAGKRT